MASHGQHQQPIHLFLEMEMVLHGMDPTGWLLDILQTMMEQSSKVMTVKHGRFQQIIHFRNEPVMR